jgi:putative hydrolase of the HAD superfamily
MHSAMLLDLYNTLLPGGDGGRAATVRAMAVDLGADPDAFVTEVVKSWVDRLTGVYGDLTTETAALAAHVGAEPSPSGLAAAVERRFAFARAHVRPPPATLTMLRDLRTAGWRLAIVSNCTFDSAAAIRGGPLASAVDALVLSCEVHLGKPDPAIYLAACSNLGVDTTDCVYVGDGADRELAGAAALGMRVIQTTQYADSDPGWLGERITSISSLVPLLADRG